MQADGDRVHVCYGLSGVTAPIDLLRQAAFYQGMYEDGLPAVGDGACPYYSFDCEEGEKYYLTNERFGMGERYLGVLDSDKLTYKEADLHEIVADDSYAWYVSYDAATGFYRIRNAATGKYLTYKSGFVTREATTFTNEDNIQLMPSRKTVKLALEGEIKRLTVKPYWVVRGNRKESPESLCASTATNLTSPQLDFNDTATNQHWVFLPGTLVEAIASGIRKTETGTEPDVVYDVSGRKVSSQLTIDNSQLAPGIYIVNGKKVVIK